jgi:hypothetical protein
MAEKDELRDEYSPDDLGEGEKGKYLKDYTQSTNVVVLEPDVARAFPNSRSVNQALRRYLQEHPLDKPEGG